MNRFKGIITALATPFKNQQVDFFSLEKLVLSQVKSGVQGFVINGTTAESPTLTKPEVQKIFNFVKSKVPTKFPLIMGTGSNSTAKSIEASMDAKNWGADAVLVVVPYYNKPPQRGLLEHFRAIASAVPIPNILYNVPTRTITALQIDTIKKLSEHPNIIGIKEASGNIEFAREIRKICGPEFLLLSGDDGTYDEFMGAGGDGAISVAAHIIPETLLKRQVRNNRELINALFTEANPIPLKMALHLMGIFDSPECRLPLVTLDEALSLELKKLMLKQGLLK